MTRLQFLAIAAPVVFIAAATPRPIANRAPGLKYTFASHVQITDPNGTTTDRVAMSGHASVLGDRGRIDLDSMAAPMNPAQQQHNGDSMRGVYFLSLDGGSRFVLVDPSKKQYMDVGGMMQGLSALSSNSGGLIKMQASNVHIDAEKIGAGPAILGHSTVHYRLTESKTMNTKILFRTVTSHDSTVTDLYYAPDLKNFINPLLSNSQMMGMLDMFGPDYKQQYMAAHSKLYQEGAPLRTISTSKVTDGSGKVRTTVSTTEVTQLSAGNVDASLFDIPAGYTKIDTSVLGSTTASAQTDSSAAHSADSANGKKSLLKKGIKGLFGRPQ